MAEKNAVWRRTGSSAGQQQQSNRPSSGASTPRDRANTPSAGKPSQDGSGQGGRGGQNQGNQRGGRRDNSTGGNNTRPPPAQNQAQTQNQTQTQAQAGPETHIPINSFNASAVKEYMKKSYSQAVAEAGGDEKTLLVKAKPSESAQPKSTAPWGARPNQMANGQNFWVELAKQMKISDEPGIKTKAAGDQSRKGKQ